MITLLTSLFVGLYWIFTNTILFASFTTTQNMGVVCIIGLIEIFIELEITIILNQLIEHIRNN